MTQSPRRAAGLAPLVAALEREALVLRVRGSLSGDAFALAHDSRAVVAGSIFIALRGARADGHAFVPAAFAAGARAVVVDADYEEVAQPAADTAVIVVTDTRRALSLLAATFYDRPSQALRVIGVTGTNGKTTTIAMIAAILEAAGIPTGLIGTLGARFGGHHVPLENTTPLALELQATLADMRERGARAVAMEISSHALATARVADVDVALAVLTNVTRDHLDFHGTFENYAATKRTLFEGARAALFNVDDSLGARWADEFARAGRATQTYGTAPGATLRASDVVTEPGGSAFTAGGVRYTLRLPGRFNVSNALAALGVARESGVDDATSRAALAAFASVPGRMEHFARDIDVFVDYAHTPDALAAVLVAAREVARGELSVVFGCGGDRDRGKRPEMGRIACELADRVLVTSDNPRSEDPQRIVAEILAGVSRSHAPRVELDRGAAIARAIAEAAPGDLVVIAGKGHETYQIVGEVAAHFDDRDVVGSHSANEPTVRDARGWVRRDTGRRCDRRNARARAR